MSTGSGVRPRSGIRPRPDCLKPAYCTSFLDGRYRELTPLFLIPSNIPQYRVALLIRTPPFRSLLEICSGLPLSFRLPTTIKVNSEVSRLGWLRATLHRFRASLSNLWKVYPSFAPCHVFFLGKRLKRQRLALGLCVVRINLLISHYTSLVSFFSGQVTVWFWHLFAPLDFPVQKGRLYRDLTPCYNKSFSQNLRCCSL
jgi:hypothetical protein